MPRPHTGAQDSGMVRMALDDERVPHAVRLIGEAMEPQACFVEDWDGEYALLSSDGEVLDVIWFVAPRKSCLRCIAIATAVIRGFSRLPTAFPYAVPFVLCLVVPSLLWLIRGWTTGSSDWLMAGLLMSLVAILVFLIWRLLVATK